MTEILGYSLDENQCVKDSGKFEGEPAYVPHLWECYLNGCEDERLDCDGIYYSVYFVDNDLRTKFPTLIMPDDFAVVLWETEQGFVLHETLTKKQYEQFVVDCATDETEED